MPLAVLATPPPPTLAPSFASSGKTSALQERLTAFARQVADAGTPAETRRAFRDLRVWLASLPPKEAVEALRTFLRSGRDERVPLAFRIAVKGDLEEAPSLRVWLLDCLGQIDRTAAADFGREILATPTSPDEWAISLRDYARVRTAPEDIAFVQGKLREMLANPDWLRNPSAGYLESFDALVYTHATSFTPDLTRLITNQDNRAAAHAAYLTLDRLVIQDPTTVLTQLEADPTLMQEREQTRANYFARADVQDQDQRALLEKYLLDPARSAQELKAFAGLFPSGNYMISNNLLTIVQTPTRDDLAGRDSAALHTVESWMNDPRFSTIRPQLQLIHTRLQTFVQQEKAQQ